MEGRPDVDVDDCNLLVLLLGISSAWVHTCYDLLSSRDGIDTREALSQKEVLVALLFITGSLNSTWVTLNWGSIQLLSSHGVIEENVTWF